MTNLSLSSLEDYISPKLQEFRPLFSRTASFENFLTAEYTVFGSIERFGVTDSARLLCDGTDEDEANRCYENIINFFRRSTSFDHHEMSRKLAEIVNGSGHVYKKNINGKERCFITIDGHNAIHSGRYMPGVKKTVQNSESPSKPQHTYAHLWGVAGVLVGSKDTLLSSVPIAGEIQQGEAEIRKWAGDKEGAEMSHVEKMMKITKDITETFSHIMLLCDTLFPCTQSIRMIKEHNGKNPDRTISMVSKVKKNTRAWDFPPEREEGTLGRPRVRGERVHLDTLFENEKESFKKVTVNLYGEKEEVSYLEKILLWGDDYTPVKFVLCSSSRGNVIFISTDLEIDAKTIIEAYALRWKCECSFKIGSQNTNAFSSHFWTKSMPRLNRYAKKTDPDPLTLVEEKDRDKILRAFYAYERYAMVAFIGQALLHLYALELASEGYISTMWLRTRKNKVVSIGNLIHDIYILFLFNSDAVRARLKPYKKKKDSSAIVK